VAQVLDGHTPGDLVVAYPGDRVSEGVAIVAQ
jgi:glyoxylase-like metal-dependent hydrolase (beta-lactamase superfamily II)